MNSKHLILGATGSIGYAYTNMLISAGIKATILVRKKEKADRLFSNHPLLEVIEGDVNNIDLLKKVSADKDILFCGINYPYQLWNSNMPTVIKNTIAAASQNHATILFPGNNYSFGNLSKPITETTIPTPTTIKGKLRKKLIGLLKEATDLNKCKVIVLRSPDFFGPNVTNSLMKPIFGNAVNNKPIKWLIDANIPHQFAYTNDVARLFHQLSKSKTLPNFFLINYGGTTIESVNQLSEKISLIANNPTKVSVAPKFVLNLISLISPELKELKENFYQFENSIILEDTKLHELYPDFKTTSMDNALKDTLNWFRNNNL